MKLSGNTILITGGSSGIGLALAQRFLARDNEVIICGRSEERLQEAKEKYPALHTICCDVAQRDDRIALYNQVISDFPAINVLINNAGVQHNLDLKDADFDICELEIATNLEAPIHLATLFVRSFLSKEDSYIINVTSRLGFMPPIWVPVYGATKAGMHSFTFTLRQQLLDTPISVIEVVPTAINTNLGGAGVHTFGADLDEYADAVFVGFEEGVDEVLFGESEILNKPRAEIEAFAIALNKRLHGDA